MSLITKIPGVTFTDTTLPKLYRDGLITVGSLYCYDFLDAFTNPYTGAVANNATFANLVAGKAAAAAVADNQTTAVVSGTNGLTIGGMYNEALDFGTTFDMAAAGHHSFLAIAWFKLDPTFSGAFPAVLSYTTNTQQANCQYAIDLGPSQASTGYSVRGSAGNATQTFGVGPGRHQAAVAWKAGKMSLFIDGALVGSDSTNATQTLATPPAGTHEGMGLASNIANAFAPFKGQIYRAYKEDLTLSMAASGRTFEAQALAQVQADWAANASRFV